MATVSAIYGTAIYGSSEYGVVNVSAAVSGISATGTIGSLTVVVNASVSISGVVGTSTINTTTVNLTELVDSVSASTAVNGSGVSVRSITKVSVSGVSATGTIAPVLAGGFEVDLTEPLQSVQGTISLGTLQVNVSKVLTGVSATNAVGTLTHSNTHALSGVQGTFTVGNIIPVANTRVSIVGVATTTIVNTLSIFGQGSVNITGIVGTISLGTITKSATSFDFQVQASLYSRKRAVSIPRSI